MTTTSLFKSGVQPAGIDHKLTGRSKQVGKRTLLGVSYRHGVPNWQGEFPTHYTWVPTEYFLPEVVAKLEGQPEQR